MQETFDFYIPLHVNLEISEILTKIYLLLQNVIEKLIKMTKNMYMQ